MLSFVSFHYCYYPLKIKIQKNSGVLSVKIKFLTSNFKSLLYRTADVPVFKFCLHKYDVKLLCALQFIMSNPRMYIVYLILNFIIFIFSKIGGKFYFLNILDTTVQRYLKFVDSGSPGRFFLF